MKILEKSKMNPFCFKSVLYITLLLGNFGLILCTEDDFVVEWDSPTLEKFSKNQPVYKVRRYWGVPDTQAEVGRYFQHRIPEDAFQSSKSFYLKLLNKPRWIQFEDNILEGVPAREDVGHSYVTVEAVSEDDTAKDIFEIAVSSTAADHSTDMPCNSQQGTSLLSVVVTGSMESFTAKRRVSLVKRFSKFLKKSVSQVQLTESPTSDPLSDGSAIMSGPGSAKQSNKGSSQLQIKVGCGGKVSSKQRKMVKSMKAATRNGQLQSILKVPVLGWHISIVDANTNRPKRQAFGEFSGDYANYDDYDNYANYDDYEDYDQFFEQSHIANNNNDQDNTTEVPTEPPEVDVGTSLKPTGTTQIPVSPTQVIEASPTVAPTNTLVFPTPTLESSLSSYPSTVVEETTPVVTPTVEVPRPTRPTQVIQPTPVPDTVEVTEYGARNFAPVINNRIPKLGWVTGHVYRMKIREDAFQDTEDGGTRNLTLVLKNSDGQILNYDSWIQLNSATQELYALPLEREISRFELQLEAIDSGQKSTVDKLNIRLTQPKEARNYNHEFTVVLQVENKFHRDLNYALDWQVRAVEKIAELYNSGVDSINVRNITTGDSIHLSWTNITLVDPTSTSCPEEELSQLKRILIEEGSRPTEHAKIVFMPEFVLKHAKIQYFKACAQLNSLHEIDHKTHENQGPVYRNQIDELRAFEGQVFRRKVEEDTCYDLEDGITGLHMRLLTADLVPPPLSNWLQFDEANREFYGLPLEQDVGKRDYLLECKDSQGKKTDDALVVTVDSVEVPMPPVEFQITIEANYDEFVSSVDQKVNLVSRIAKAFGDSSTQNIRVSRFERGSVIVYFTNSSLPASPCPEDTIETLRSVMTDDSGMLQESFKAAFLPTFRVNSAQVTPMGHCLAGDTPTHAAMPDVGEPADVPEEQERNPDEDYLLTFIIPAVLIALMLILAGLVAWCLWRRRRYAKLSLTDENFVPKGVPVIFAEELDDHHSDGANIPVIMKEEKPPLPPPEYRHSPGMATPPRGERSVSEHGPYQPPHPPYASTNGNRNPRPNMPPAYRKPPTYVPP